MSKFLFNPLTGQLDMTDSPLWKRTGTELEVFNAGDSVYIPILNNITLNKPDSSSEITDAHNTSVGSNLYGGTEYYYGVYISAINNTVISKVTRNSYASTATNCYIYDKTNSVLLDTSSFVGNDAFFNVELTASNEYFILVNSSTARSYGENQENISCTNIIYKRGVQCLASNPSYFSYLGGLEVNYCAASQITSITTGLQTTITINSGTKLTTTGICSVSGSNTGDQDLSGKQDLLVSGTNIKTINSTSILGSGNIVTPDTKTFLTLTDTPDSYSGKGYELPSVTTDESALEFNNTLNFGECQYMARVSPDTPSANYVSVYLTSSGTTPNKIVEWKIKNEAGEEIILSSIKV